MADLVSAILAVCTANGWSQQGSVLYRNNAFVEVTSGANFVNFLAGTGQTAGVLSGPATNVRMVSHSDMQEWTFPVNYDIHIFTNPDEVYIVVNHDTVKFQHAAWGMSTVPDIGGTGMWISATCGNVVAGGVGFQTFGGAYDFGANNAWGFALFGQRSGAVARRSSFIHGVLNGTTGWITSPYAFNPLAPLLESLPNNWNGETILLPMPVIKAWSSGAKVSLLAQPANLRACRITNHDPFDIVTIAGDDWKIYPWRHKNPASPNGVSNVDTSGTWGCAIRYTGP
jgi:hypothetical protein